ncbi:single-stranded DNA-binding protein [Streptomyces mirabilis]
MRNELPLTVIGNLVDDPELRFTSAGVPVARFTVASTPRVFDRDTNAWRDGEATFMDCSAWRQLAENLAGSVSKGSSPPSAGAAGRTGLAVAHGSSGAVSRGGTARAVRVIVTVANVIDAPTSRVVVAGRLRTDRWESPEGEKPVCGTPVLMAADRDAVAVCVRLFPREPPNPVQDGARLADGGGAQQRGA